MTLGLFGCGSGLSDTTKRLTPQQSEDSEQNADHTGNEDQQAEADTTEKKAEDGSSGNVLRLPIPILSVCPESAATDI